MPRSVYKNLGELGEIAIVEPGHALRVGDAVVVRQRGRGSPPSPIPQLRRGQTEMIQGPLNGAIFWSPARKSVAS